MHDPTQKDMQYPDIGNQYRSEIFFVDQDQKVLAEMKMKEMNLIFKGKIETKISELKNYCKAEEYHQKYIMKNTL